MESNPNNTYAFSRIICSAFWKDGVTFYLIWCNAMVSAQSDINCFQTPSLFLHQQITVVRQNLVGVTQLPVDECRHLWVREETLINWLQWLLHTPSRKSTLPLFCVRSSVAGTPLCLLYSIPDPYPAKSTNQLPPSIYNPKGSRDFACTNCGPGMKHR